MTRTLPPGTQTIAPDALIIPPATRLPGRAAAGLPLRREGPEKLTGLAKYADDLVFPGAWFGATIRSTEPHATLLAIERRPDAFDWSRWSLVTAADIPGDNVVSLIRDDQPILVPVGGEIRHQAEPLCPHRRPRPRDAARRQARTCASGPSGCRPSSIRSSRATSSRITRSAGATWRRLRRGRAGDRGHLSGRPPGAALHREQRDDRRAPGRRRGHRPRLVPVPVLRPPALKRSLGLQTMPGAWWSRPRPAAASAARRSTPRSSPCTPRCWPARSASRCA